MDLDKIKFATFEVFITCNIKSFPIDCIDIIKIYGYKPKSYSSQKPAKKDKCLLYSDEAFIAKKNVYYNDEKLIGRVRFSLAHEIGHIVMKHDNPRTDEQEKEADKFASYLLAPRMAIHYSKCKNYFHVAKQFNISFESAQYSFQDYKCWHKKAAYKMDFFDKSMYQHFYNDNYNGFVYNVKKCSLCHEEILNESSSYCPTCFNKISYMETYKHDYFFGESELLSRYKTY